MAFYVPFAVLGSQGIVVKCTASLHLFPQTCTQSPLAFWSAGGRQERVRDSGELEFQLPQDFCGKTMQAVTGQPIKKNFFFEFPRVSPGAHPLIKKPEDSGYEIAQFPPVSWIIAG